MQQELVARRKAGEIGDQFLIVEHPHVVTVGRNGHEENLLASPEVLPVPESKCITPTAAGM